MVVWNAGRDRLANLLDGPNPMVLDVYAGGVLLGNVPASMLTDTTIRRGRDNARDTPSADTMTSAIVGGLTVAGRQLAVAMGVRFRLSDTALDALYGTHVSAAALRARARFTGQLTDLGDVQLIPDKAATTMVLPLTASSVVARLNGTNIARVPWVAGTSDVQILIDTLSDVWTADPGVRLAEWSTVGTKAAWYAPAAARAPVAAGARFVQWDVDNLAATGIIGDLQASTAGVLVEQRDGRLDWVIPEARRAVPIAVSLDAHHIMAPAKVAQSLADLVDRAKVTYGPSGAPVDITVEDAGAVADHGVYLDAVATRLAAAAAATDMATDMVGRYAWPFWRLPKITVDLTALMVANEPNMPIVRALIEMEMGALIELTGLPTTSPVAGGLFWVEGCDERISSRRWLMDLSLVAFGLLTPPVRWSELDTSLRWTDVPADVQWLRGATSWQPNPFPVASWRTVAANTKWSALPATTWANF